MVSTREGADIDYILEATCVFTNHTGKNNKFGVRLCSALFIPFVMLSLDQLKEIQKSAELTCGLLRFHLETEQSVADHLRLTYALVTSAVSLSEEDCQLLRQLAVFVYPELAAGDMQTPNAVPDEEPEHVTTQWVADYLKIARSTFYAQVHKKLLFPVKKIGKRPYYLKPEVMALMKRHEKGAWTYAKLAKQRGST